MAAVKYFDKYYVGTRDSGNTLPLGFAVPDGTDSAARKRKESVDTWASAHYYKPGPPPKVGVEYDNLPRSGFRVVDWEGREVTDNKVVRVEDPLGFELEIYIPNFIELLLKSKIDNGLIEGDLVLLRDGPNNRLVRADEPIFAQAKKETRKKKPSKLTHVPGDIIECMGINYLYMGLMDVEYLVPGGDKIVDEYMTDLRNYYPGGSLGAFFGGHPAQRTTVYYKKENTSVQQQHVGRRHVYVRQDRHNVMTDLVELRKSQMTTRNIISSNNPLPDNPEDKVWTTLDNMYYDETGTLLDVKQAESLIQHTGRSFHSSEGIVFWSTNAIRFQDGKITTPLDPKNVVYTR